MHCLKTTTQYEITIASLISYCKKFIIIQFLNTHPSKLHFQNILNDPNLFTLHILCLNETKIQNVQTHEEIDNLF
jgi:DNA polymerase sigma